MGVKGASVRKQLKNFVEEFTYGEVQKPKKGGEERGVQIDLLIDRADNCVNLCENKYCHEEYVVSTSYEKKLREKKSIFLAHTKTKKA